MDKTDIVERLNDAHANSVQRIAGSDIFAEAADLITTLRAEKDRAYTIGYDSAAKDYVAKVAGLEAENERLRAALQKIEDQRFSGNTCERSFWKMIDYARAALAPKDTANG